MNQEEILKSRFGCFTYPNGIFAVSQKRVLFKRGDTIVTREIALGVTAPSGVLLGRVVAGPSEQRDPSTSPPSLSP